METTACILQIYPQLVSSVDFRVISEFGVESIAEWHSSEPQPTQDQLNSAWIEVVRSRKIAELTQANNNSSPTFTSSALGTVHTYLSDEIAMAKLNGEYAFINGPAYDGSTVNWYTIEAGGVIHTKDQFNQVWLDGRTVMVNNFNNWDSLVKQVKQCTTLDQINAISW